MKRVLAICLFAASTAMVGCGGSGEPQNIMDGADEAAVLSYEEMVAADEAAMSASPDDAEVAETPAADTAE